MYTIFAYGALTGIVGTLGLIGLLSAAVQGERHIMRASQPAVTPTTSLLWKAFSRRLVKKYGAKGAIDVLSGRIDDAWRRNNDRAMVRYERMLAYVTSENNVLRFRRA